MTDKKYDIQDLIIDTKTPLSDMCLLYKAFFCRCEDEPPRLAGHTDGWGKLLKCQLITSSAWKEQKRISAEEGLIAIPYEIKQPHSR